MSKHHTPSTEVNENMSKSWTAWSAKLSGGSEAIAIQAEPPQTTSVPLPEAFPGTDSTTESDVKNNEIQPGAVAVVGFDGRSDDNTVVVGGEEDPSVAVLSARIVDERVEESLRHQLVERNQVIADLEAERNRIVVAEEVRTEDNHPCDDEAPREHKRTLLIGCTVVVMVIVAVIIGTVVGLGGRNNVPTKEQLVTLFSSKSPDTLSNLEDPTSNQYRAIQWLVEDVKTNGFNLDNNQAQIIQRGTLAILFYSLLGDTGRWCNSTGWLEHGLSECDWFGVTCISKRVTKLDLQYTEEEDGQIKRSNNNLGGTLPKEIVYLDRIKALWLWGSVSGTIPTELGQLTRLERLGLDRNEFTGSLPTELGLLTELDQLSLDHNNFSGSLPTELGLLSKLERLRLDSNELTGTLVTELGLLTRLDWLDLEQNKCTGALPTEIGLLWKLDWLDLPL